MSIEINKTEESLNFFNNVKYWLVGNNFNLFKIYFYSVDSYNVS